MTRSRVLTRLRVPARLRAVARLRLLVPVALVVVALAGVGVFGYSAWQAAFGAHSAAAAARDDAVDAARTQVKTLATLDYRKADKGLDRWAHAATGGLASKLKQSRDSDRKQARRTKSVSTIRITSAAATKVNADAGTATVLTSGRLRIGANGKHAWTRKAGFTAEMRRTEDGWKVEALASTGGGTP